MREAMEKKQISTGDIWGVQLLDPFYRWAKDYRVRRRHQQISRHKRYGVQNSTPIFCDGMRKKSDLSHANKKFSHTWGNKFWHHPSFFFKWIFFYLISLSLIRIEFKSKKR